mmetsp:Transcript_14240/g.38639  ORF Transcript_14240/g.38639 Transcript_14240/m.38639 type:complete len:220 (-) Transcript_14240:216-875(-)
MFCKRNALGKHVLSRCVFRRSTLAVEWACEKCNEEWFLLCPGERQGIQARTDLGEAVRRASSHTGREGSCQICCQIGSQGHVGSHIWRCEGVSASQLWNGLCLVPLRSCNSGFPLDLAGGRGVSSHHGRGHRVILGLSHACVGDSFWLRCTLLLCCSWCFRHSCARAGGGGSGGSRSCDICVPDTSSDRPAPRAGNRSAENGRRQLGHPHHEVRRFDLV